MQNKGQGKNLIKKKMKVVETKIDPKNYKRMKLLKDDSYLILEKKNQINERRIV